MEVFMSVRIGRMGRAHMELDIPAELGRCKTYLKVREEKLVMQVKNNKQRLSRW